MSSLATVRARITEAPLRGSLIAGVVLSGFSVVLAVLAFGAVALVLDSSRWGPSAAEGLSEMSKSRLLLVAVLLIPAFETLLGQSLPIEIARRLRVGPTGCVWISAPLFGAGTSSMAASCTGSRLSSPARSSRSATCSSDTSDPG